MSKLTMSLALRCWRPGGLRILTYHRIGNEGLPGQVSVKRFEEHLAFLAERCTFVSTSEWLDAPHRFSTSHKPPVAVTFDDGYRDNYELAYPLLRRYRVAATIFVATGLVGREYLGSPMLSPDQMREMANTGIEFGAHTVKHRILASLRPSEVLREVGDSKADIEDMTGRPASGFAYPNGRERDFTAANVSAVREAGFAWAATTIHGNNAVGCDQFRLRRIGMRDCGVEELAMRMSGLLDAVIQWKQRSEAGWKGSKGADLG